MRTVIDITINDLRILFRNRSLLVNLVFIPLVISYVVGFALGEGGGGVSTSATLIVDVIDADSTALSQQFLSDLRSASTGLVLCPMDNNANDVCQLKGASLDETLSVQRLKSQTSLALIEIPASFSADVTAGKSVSIVYRSNEQAIAPSFILQAVQAVTQKLGGAVIAQRVGTDAAASLSVLKFSDDADRAAFGDAIRQRASALWAENPVQVDYIAGAQQAPTKQAGPYGLSQSMPGIGTMYAMLIVFTTGASIIVERKNWTLPRLATMPISRAQIVGGKLLTRVLLGLFEYALMLGFGLILGVRYGSDPLAIVLLTVTFSLAVTALMLALTTLLKNEGQVRGIALFLSLTLAPLGGAWWPLDIVPAWMRIVGHISPVAWVMDGFTSVIFNGGNIGTVIVPVLVLLGMAVVFFAYGVRRFKFVD